MAYAGYRVALDDEPYTYASFCAWYGNAEAERIWQESPVSEEGCNAAPAHMAPTATEHGNPPHTQIAPAATEHGNPARIELVETERYMRPAARLGPVFQDFPSSAQVPRYLGAGT